jgi:4-hydroxybenzoate polyprenyltransferase
MLTSGARPAMSAVEAWMRALRLHHWSKNLLLFVPLVVGHAYQSPQNIALAGAGFVILCILSSATYLVNDLADLEADRRHPTRRRRPFASGDLPVVAGLIAAPLMIVAALAAAFALSPAFAVALFAYLALTCVYSFALKRVALIDAMTIATLFTLRIVMGIVLLRLDPSPWLLSFSEFFFFSLALAKRHGEVMRAVKDGEEGISGRGYRGDDWPLTLTFGVGAGLASIVIMLLYLANDAAPVGFYRHPLWLDAVPFAVVVWLQRVWLLAHRRELHDDPIVFALRDGQSLALGAVAAIAFVLAL